MPEGPELKIMTEYVNDFCNKKNFSKIVKSDINKNIKIDFKNFNMLAFNRGKEMKLILSNNDDNMTLIFTMGMTGHWYYSKYFHNLTKHTHLKFESEEGVLCFVDARRFGRWKIQNNWSHNRGPDIIDDFDNFSINILNNIDNNFFNNPIYLVLMDQRYFNGIGNYLRSEILFKYDINPFLPSNEVLNKNFLLYVRSLMIESYNLGGGSIFTWKNPYNIDNKEKFLNWLECYQNKNCVKIKDKNNRTFCFSKKYDLLCK